MYTIAHSAEMNSIYQLEDETLSAFDVNSLLSNLLPNLPENVGVAKKQNVRQELMRDLYNLYLEACNKEYYVKNKKRYFRYVKTQFPHLLRAGEFKSKAWFDCRQDFKKAKLPDHQKYLKPYESGEYMWYKRFNKNTQDELREMISNAKSMIHRKQNVIGYILKEEKFSPVDPLA